MTEFCRSNGSERTQLGAVSRGLVLVDPEPALRARALLTSSADSLARTIEFFVGAETVFVTDAARPGATIPRTWDPGGAQHVVRPDDRLSMWRVVAGMRTSEAIVDSSLIVDLL